MSSTKWKRDEDEVKSARILLEEAQASKGLYQVQEIPLPDIPGYTVLAFALPNVIRQWGGRVRELALDSACECPCSIADLKTSDLALKGIPTGRDLKFTRYWEKSTVPDSL